jgi:hypothetical protein
MPLGEVQNSRNLLRRSQNRGLAVRTSTWFTETERTDPAAPGTNTCSSIGAKLPVLRFLPPDLTTMKVLLGIMVERLIS